ncbi:hypothetical protein [Bradyrhizobium elkanii]
MQTITPWCAVVAANEAIARQYMDAFKLSSEIWDARVYDTALGAQYEHIVLIRPHWRLSPAEIAHFEQLILPMWLTRLSRTGKMKVI